MRDSLIKIYAILVLLLFILVQISKGFAASLPSQVDNSRKKFFPPIIRQRHNSCGQAAGAYYTFTYEINCLRNTAADNDSRRYPTHFTYNFLNNGKNMGTLTEAGWRVVQSIGVPSIKDYGSFYKNDTSCWMSGYRKYLNALHNRVKSYRSIDLRKADGLAALKRWLYNHDSKDKRPGGLATFRAGVRKAEIKKIASNQYKSGKHIYTKFKHKGGHFMTIVGYDDKVAYDYNGDGKITNNIDITGDGKVDVRDYERGAFLIANSRGPKWYDKGKIYTSYRLFALPVNDGGVFNHRAQVVEVMDYTPKMTLRLKYSFNKRKKLRLKVASRFKTQHGWEEYSLQPRMFSEFWGSGEYNMRGKNDAKPIELCVDISKLKGFLDKYPKADLDISFESCDKDAKGEIISADLVIHGKNNADKFINILSKKRKIVPAGTKLKLKRKKFNAFYAKS